MGKALAKGLLRNQCLTDLDVSNNMFGHNDEQTKMSMVGMVFVGEGQARASDKALKKGGGSGGDGGGGRAAGGDSAGGDESRGSANEDDNTPLRNTTVVILNGLCIDAIAFGTGQLGQSLV